MSNTIITGNTITTTGSNGEGMYLHANGGMIRNTTITGNTVEAVNFNSDGIFLRADGGGTLSGAIVANNTVTTAGTAARGIFVSTQNSTLNDVMVAGNTVTTTGPNDAIGDSTGVFLRSNANGMLRDVTVVGNTLSTAGNLAQGIFVFIDVLPRINDGGFWVQTAIAGVARLILPRPMDNALPIRCSPRNFTSR